MLKSSLIALVGVASTAVRRPSFAIGASVGDESTPAPEGGSAATTAEAFNLKHAKAVAAASLGYEPPMH